MRLKLLTSIVLAVATFAAPALADMRDPMTGNWISGRRGPQSAPAGFGPRSNFSLFGPSTVAVDAKYRPGSIIIRTRERKLYFVTDSGQAIVYGIGVGRIGFTWSGVKTVTDKREWPGWTPPPQMRLRQPGLPAHMPGGINNPLGARALYLGSSLYRIHGSNEPETIGQAVSSGCFRMHNDDVIDLYNRVRVGAQVYVFQ
jgi:lipoprotein-anchoring transpeptidase ErfK/SrfK